MQSKDIATKVNAIMKAQRAALILSVMVLGLCLSQTAQADHRRIVVQGFEADDNNMSLQLNIGGLTLADDAMDVSGVAQLGGAGLAWRWDLVHWGGLELAFQGYGRTSEGGRVNEDAVATSINWLWYFARNHHHRFYAVTGIGGVSTNGTIDDDFDYSYSEGGLNLGVGTEWLVSRRFLISADLRTLLLSRNDESVSAFDWADGTPYGNWTVPPEERTGIQFNMGIGYRW